MESHLPFVGMAREIGRLSLAFGAGDPVLLLGPQGSGKTRLIKEALRSHKNVLYIAWKPTLHDLLAAMARALIAAHHADFLRRAALTSGPGADPEAWLAVQTSIHLKGLLWTAVESSSVTMMLDGIAGAGFPAYRFFQRISHTPGMALFAASRDAFSLGALARLFWNPAQVLNVPPLPERNAKQLFEPPPAISSCATCTSRSFVIRCWRVPAGTQGRLLRCAGWPPSRNTMRGAILSSLRSASIRS